ncbi:hypothetical protein ACNJQJ_23100, partial [Mycobacterium tuberculosis]
MRQAHIRIRTAQQRTSLADEFDRVSRIAVAEPVAVVTSPELDQWDDVSRRMFIPFHDG